MDRTSKFSLPAIQRILALRVTRDGIRCRAWALMRDCETFQYTKRRRATDAAPGQLVDAWERERGAWTSRRMRQPLGALVRNAATCDWLQALHGRVATVASRALAARHILTEDHAVRPQ